MGGLGDGILFLVDLCIRFGCGFVNVGFGIWSKVFGMIFTTLMI